MAIFKTLFAENRFIILLGTVLVLASAVANVGIVHFINLTIASEGAILRQQPVLIISVLLLAFFLAVVSQMMMTQLGHTVIFQMRGKLLRQVLNCEYDQLKAIGRNKIYATITRDIDSIQDGFIDLPLFMYAFTMACAGLAYMVYLDGLLAAVTIVNLVATFLISRALLKRFRKEVERERELEDTLFKSYEELLDGHKELLLNEDRGDRIFQGIMEGPATESRERMTLADRYIVLNINFMTTIMLAQVLIIFFLVFMFDLGGLALATSFAITLMFMRQPINMAANLISGILTAQVAVKKLTSLNLPPESRDTYTPAPDWQTLMLKDIEYTYDTDSSDFKLGPVNTTIQRGETLFLVGHNGAGKTSLIRLLIGLTKPTRGDILLDNIPLTDSLRRGYRAQFSAVLSDFHLFSHLESSQTVNTDIVKPWLEKLDLSHKVTFENNEFSTTDLSTGQRKRLAMVTAVSEARKLMVLDEWTADQDPNFRKQFYYQLLPELKSMGYTCFVVSHDDRYFDAADRILILDQGKITEQNSHKETVVV